MVLNDSTCLLTYYSENLTKSVQGSVLPVLEIINIEEYCNNLFKDFDFKAVKFPIFL